MNRDLIYLWTVYLGEEIQINAISKCLELIADKFILKAFSLFFFPIGIGLGAISFNVPQPQAPAPDPASSTAAAPPK